MRKIKEDPVSISVSCKWHLVRNGVIPKSLRNTRARIIINV